MQALATWLLSLVRLVSSVADLCLPEHPAHTIYTKTTLKQQMAGANGLKKWRAMPNGVPQLCHMKFRPYEEPNFLIKVFLWHTLS